MRVTSLPSIPGARHRRKRVGRGIGSGHGKTSTRGQKGQRARTGHGTKKPGFEGGQNPLIRRLPKRGFRRKATGRQPQRAIVNVSQLNQFPEGHRVTPEELRQAGLIRDTAQEIKLLGEGALSKRLTVAVHRVSASAQAKVTEAGGTIELLEKTQHAQGSGLRAQGGRHEPPAPSPQPPA